jgi:hypothetical protein
MANILLIEKTGIVKSLPIKKYDEPELYKKAGFKTSEGFKLMTIWEIDNKCIHLFGKITGKANQENKYEFPPPMDNMLFFNNCILVNKNAQNIVQNLSITEWENIYSQLFGGFDDIGSDGEEDEEDILTEDDEIDPSKCTKTGYVKDGFIVEDDISEDDESEESDTSNGDDEEEVKPKKKPVKKPKVVAKKSAKRFFETIIEKEEVAETYLDCASELSEESYV